VGDRPLSLMRQAPPEGLLPYQSILFHASDLVQLPRVPWLPSDVQENEGETVPSPRQPPAGLQMSSLDRSPQLPKQRVKMTRPAGTETAGAEVTRQNCQHRAPVPAGVRPQLTITTTNTPTPKPIPRNCSAALEGIYTYMEQPLGVAFSS